MLGNRYEVCAAAKCGNEWTIFRTDDARLALNLAEAHRAQPLGYSYRVWDTNRDCELTEDDLEETYD